jgi:very-short-patch-repair endonuclease
MSIAIARRLRADRPDVEKRLWSRLRDRGLLGLKFHRQVPLGDFVADFVCAVKHRLLSSMVAGTPHRRLGTIGEPRGWRVIRFWSNEVNENIEGVLQAIATACGIDVDPPRSHPHFGPHRRPHPDPLPQGEGEGARRAGRRMLSCGYAPCRRP